MVDIQAQLDAYLAAHPDLQQYVTKLYYVPAAAGGAPADATHQVRLASTAAPERGLLVAAVVVPRYAVALDLLLAMAATQPRPAPPAAWGAG